MKKRFFIVSILMVLFLAISTGCSGGIKCGKCGGTGDCTNCNGTGKIIMNNKCYVCSGDGKCDICSGTGRL